MHCYIEHVTNVLRPHAVNMADCYILPLKAPFCRVPPNHFAIVISSGGKVYRWALQNYIMFIGTKM